MQPSQFREEVHFEPGPFLIGSVLVGVGALLAFLGVVIGGLHSVNQGIRWVRSWEQDPAHLAKEKWARVKAVSAASTDAWKGSAPGEPAHHDGQ
jgi:hypothetical protein